MSLRSTLRKGYPFSSKSKTCSTHNELPGEILEEGSYYSLPVLRGEVCNGELIAEIRYVFRSARKEFSLSQSGSSPVHSPLLPQWSDALPFRTKPGLHLKRTVLLSGSRTDWPSFIAGSLRQRPSEKIISNSFVQVNFLQFNYKLENVAQRSLDVKPYMQN